MKKLTTVLCLVLAASVFASCTDNRGGRRSGDDDDESSKTEETQSVETNETEEQTVETRPVAETSEAAPSEFALPVFPEDPAYDDIMEFFRVQHETDSSVQFAISDGFDQDSQSWYWGLWLVYPDGSAVCYRRLDDGTITEVEDNSGYWSRTYTYDEISGIPVICNYEEDIRIGQSVPDGVYFGSLEAVSEDLSYALVCIGEPVYRSMEELSQYSVGDTIHIDEIDYDFVISDIGDGYIDSEDGEPFFSTSYVNCIDEDNILMLCGYSDNPYHANDRYLILPISPDCEITDYFSYLSERDDVDPSLDNGTALSRSYYWTYIMRDEFEVSMERANELSNNGFHLTEGFLYPVHVENGEIVSMNLEWR